MNSCQKWQLILFWKRMRLNKSSKLENDFCSFLFLYLIHNPI